MASAETIHRTGVRGIRKLHRNGEAIIALTAYDAWMARLADEAGAHLLLVGDSLGMTMLGYDTTVPVTLEQSLHHTAAVVRGSRRAMVVGDMPFLTYHIDESEALRNAGRYLQEAGASAVKLEGGRSVASTVRRLVEAGIPVLGHIGILPQSVLAEGGYRIHGRSDEEADELRDDVRALEEAGAFGIVLEGLPTELSEDLTEQAAVPTIGIGAGPHCNGQIQVTHDLLGLNPDFCPKHAKRYAQLGEQMREALQQYGCEVRNRAFPGPEQTVHR